MKRIIHALRGFPPAWNGLVRLVKTERHARFHLVATVGVIVAGLVLQISRYDWMWITLAMGMVWAAEAINSGLERLADRITRETDQEIGAAKDLAAGGVLAAAIAAVVIGALVFLPYLSL
ncbi:MAG: diacylglycerol kinase family protein [Verrucomicrobiaceae bacterium]|nr:diacylglycerol kinase family protein [Verrucomicrobiaceae bacterium]